MHLERVVLSNAWALPGSAMALVRQLVGTSRIMR